MERERKSQRFVLRSLYFILCLLDVFGCTAVGIDTRVSADIVLSDTALSSKSANPDENSIRDANIFIFSDDGFLEKSIYLKGNSCPVLLVKGRKYRILACANLGYEIKNADRETIEQLEFHLAYPDDFSTGMPMCGTAENVDADGRITIEMERLCSKISVAFDRSRLDSGVSMTVSRLTVGNCPRKCRVFGPSAVTDHDGCFTTGFDRDYSGCKELNKTHGDGISGEVSLYMLENRQGQFPGNPQSESERVFPEGHSAAELCSYIEAEMEYNAAGGSVKGRLKYRFYLGESLRDLNVERNSHYHFTIVPEGNGLKESSWRVDKTGLTAERYFEMTPKGYIEAEIGDIIHIRCSYSPPWADFYPGTEELEEDKARGIYDYEMDDDGKGVILTITGYGSGMVYMSAGAPVNESGLLYIHVKGTEENES